jgi:PEGA domain
LPDTPGELVVCTPDKDYVMSRVIGFVVCGFTLAACTAPVPSLDFLKSSPSTTSLRFESVPPGAEVKVSGQTCRTPCELKLEVAELSVIFTRRGYQQQTISVHSEGGAFSVPQFSPNPVHADLRPVVASQRGRAKMEASASNAAPMSADVTVSSSAPEAAALPPTMTMAR